MENVSTETISKNKSRSSRAFGWAALLMLLAVALAMVAIPLWSINPFQRHSQGQLELAYKMREWAPIATLFFSAPALALAVCLWRGTGSRWRKAALVVILLLTFASAWMARRSLAEWAFQPLPNPAYADVGEAGFVEDGDKVLAIEINGDAVAYPVRQIAYHHIVEDMVGGVPVAVTY